MRERGKAVRRLLVAIPAGLLVTLLVFAVMEYLATSGKPSGSELDRYVKASRIRESGDPKPRGEIGPVTIFGSGPPYEAPDGCCMDWIGPEPPVDLRRPLPSNTDRQPIPRDADAVRQLLAEPDRPRNANWILLKGAKPRYPPKALHKGKAGHAVVEFVITEEGRTADISVIEESGPEFARAARRAVGDWLFIPRRENGKPVTSETVRLRIEFRIREDGVSLSMPSHPSRR